MQIFGHKYIFLIFNKYFFINSINKLLFSELRKKGKIKPEGQYLTGFFAQKLLDITCTISIHGVLKRAGSL